MAGLKRTALAGIAAVVLVGLSGCPSPFLSAIKQAIANAPFDATRYKFVRQWGNPNPAFAFNNPIIKADTASHVYVADSSYRIRTFNLAGSLLSTIGAVSLQGTNAELYDMAFDASGNMYVVGNNTNQVQKYSSAGTLVLEWGGATTYGAQTLSDPRGIGVDAFGGVYVVDSGGNRVVKFDSSGNYVTEWGGSTTYGSPAAAMSFPTGIAIDRNGFVYVLDGNNNRVLKFNAVTTSPPALSTWWGGATTYATFAMSFPVGISISSGTTQNIYVVDGGGTNNSRVLKFSTSGSYVTSWGSLGTTDGAFTDATSVAVDSAGDVYVTDSPSSSFESRVQKFNGSATPPTFSMSWGGPLGSGTGVTLTPWSVAFDSSGNITVSEIWNSRVHKFDSNGNSVATWSGFSFPTGIAIDSAGQTFVAELSGNRYQVLDSSGVSTKTVTNGPMSQPIGIAVDSSGNVYVADSGNSRVLKFGPNGFVVGSPWGGVGSGDGQFSSRGDYGIAVDSSGGFVYVTDWQANRIQKFDLAGNFLGKWGTLGTGNGQFNTPLGVAVDKLGNVYVCDMLNRRIQKFNSNGKFLTSFGGVGAGNGKFAWPLGIAVSQDGNVVVTDYVGSLVQEFSPDI